MVVIVVVTATGHHECVVTVRNRTIAHNGRRVVGKGVSGQKSAKDDPSKPVTSSQLPTVT
jgi:hypothetical protein